ncbi:MAG TPA: hypothetical protein VEX41_00360 [Candidatus Eisenbacteria bacterium]|nr:hypothetical protein [Candidatus Eisenbacteria bacterium]
MEAVALRAGSSRLFAVAGYAAIASGVLAIPMVVTLAAMYAGFALGPGAREMALRFGTINDSLTIVVYGLLLPVIPAMHVIVKETGSARSVVLALVGAAGIVFTMVLQWLLISGAMPFQQQIGPVSASLLATGAWILGASYLASKVGFLPNGLRNGILGGLYLGLPVWGIDLGRRFLARRS